MATLSFSTFLALHKPSLSLLSPSSSPSLPCRSVRLRSHGVASSSTRHRIATAKPNKRRGLRRLRSAEEETLAPEQDEEPGSSQQEEAEAEGEVASSSKEQAVSVPVSPSDTLTMFFQADGTLSEAAIPTVIQALEEIEGVSNLKVKVIEGIASVELEKLTTVQATGVASSLVESIQGSGFKLQTLNLSFADEESIVV
ncbi:uncharacterized protein LOC21387031 [Morus notabilis]|uniref:uncharacterized protein LOC21387031 n=1 Tax=Morus notabilis TaxID=981085 RepID=UPI000CED73C9|nr:uncharacterized protein LOC21387031 [Morus notabilis]